jgi:glycosyltransferase involved in cell wall biosynthesis
MGIVPAVTSPLVTCVCVTKNRREWLPKAIRNFLLQTYANKELLIVADGESVSDLIPADPQIRLGIVDDGMTIGAKRNIGAGFAQGQIIIHWDDDDYSHPYRVQDQVGLLLRSRNAVVGYHSMYFTDGEKWWQYHHRQPYAIGSSLCYHRHWWLAHRFDGLHVGEDSAFSAKAAEAGQLSSSDALDMMVASIHPENTCRRSLDPSNYEPLTKPGHVGTPFAA